MRGVDEQMLPLPIYAGLMNHRLVDRYTDSHPVVKQSKSLFTAKRRRFAGIALDIVFDHFLIKHFPAYASQSLEDFLNDTYRGLATNLHCMPTGMQRDVTKMIEGGWLESYDNLESVGRALDNTASRIRFDHQFYGAVEDIRSHYSEIEDNFIQFMPQLISHVYRHTPEAWQATHISV